MEADRKAGLPIAKTTCDPGVTTLEQKENMESQMTNSFKIDYLEFTSSNLGATSRFLADAFGWNAIDYGPGYSGAADAGIDVGIGDSENKPIKPLLPVIRTQDLELALEQVVAAGGLITQDPFDFPGGRRFHFREPGGNELAVWIATE